jgi:hypothetical protein
MKREKNKVYMFYISYTKYIPRDLCSGTLYGLRNTTVPPWGSIRISPQISPGRVWSGVCRLCDGSVCQVSAGKGYVCCNHAIS